MKKQVLIKKTVVGWFNLYEKGKLIGNFPPETMKKLIPGFSGTSDLATYELNLSVVKKLKEAK